MLIKNETLFHIKWKKETRSDNKKTGKKENMHAKHIMGKATSIPSYGFVRLTQRREKTLTTVRFLFLFILKRFVVSLTHFDLR